VPPLFLVCLAEARYITMLFKTPFEAICKFFCTLKTKNYGVSQDFNEQETRRSQDEPTGEIRKESNQRFNGVSEAIPKTPN
jgi:hypothetical protein